MDLIQVNSQQKSQVSPRPASELQTGIDFPIVLFEWRPFKALYELCLGLQYLAATLRNANFDVRVLVFEEKPVEVAAKEILALKPRVVGIQLFRETAEQSFVIARMIKEAAPEIVTVMGGHTATLHAANIINSHPEIDVIVTGEGDVTIVDLCTRILKGEDFAGCKGTIYRRNNGAIHRNPPRGLVREMDTLPMPAPDVILEQTKAANPCVVANMQTSRGCMAACAFCVENRVYEGDRNLHWRGKSPEVIVDEIEKIHQLFPDKRLVIRFTDSSFEDPDGQTKQRFTRIFDLIEERGLDMAFSFFTRAESWEEKDEPLIQRLRRLGLFKVNIGFETGSRVSLKSVFRKRANVEDNLRTADLFTRNGVFVFGYSIMFQPFTMLDELRVNADFLQRVHTSFHPEMWTHDLIIHSDTRIFKHTVSNGLILGPDSEGGYVFDYAFEDSRVGKAHKVMQRVRNNQSTIDYGETIVKLELEMLLYNVWKDRYEEMQRVRQEMAEHEAEVKRVYDEAGDRQYALFMELVDAAENDKTEQVEQKIVEGWDEALTKARSQLERSWMRCSIGLARKGVRLV